MNHLDKDRGRRICSRMKQLKLTVRDTAKRLKVSPATVSAWREGRTINTCTLKALCDLLLVSETWLIRGHGSTINNQEVELIIKYRTLPPKVQRTVKRLICDLHDFHTDAQRKDDDA